MINSNKKGKRVELMLAKLLQSFGFNNSRRGRQYSGDPSAPDVVCDDLPNIHIECKGDERFTIESKALREACDQSRRDSADNETPVVIWKRNRQPWRMSFATDCGIVTVAQCDIKKSLISLNSNRKDALFINQTKEICIE